MPKKLQKARKRVKKAVKKAARKAGDTRLNRRGTVGTEPVMRGGRRGTEIKAGKLGSVFIPKKRKSRKKK